MWFNVDLVEFKTPCSSCMTLVHTVINVYNLTVCSTVSDDHVPMNLSKAPGSNRPNKSISSLAFANSDNWSLSDFDYEYMKLMANRGMYFQHNKMLVSGLDFSQSCLCIRIFLCVTLAQY